MNEKEAQRLLLRIWSDRGSLISLIYWYMPLDWDACGFTLVFLSSPLGFNFIPELSLPVGQRRSRPHTLVS